MSKKSIDRKSARKFIIENRNEGKTDQEIYEDLSQLYYDKKSLALLITGTPTQENIAKYSIYNFALIALLVGVGVLKVFVVAGLSLAAGQPLALLLVFLVPIVNVYFIYEFIRYSAPAYRICGALAIVSFLQSLSNMSGAMDFISTLVLTGGIAALSFYLDDKLFPNYAPKKLTKDEKGDYMFFG